MSGKFPLIFLFLTFPLFAQTNQPWNNPLMIAKSTDGINFYSFKIFQDSSGVPSAIQWKGDTLVCVFQWFRQPINSLTWDRVAVKYSYDRGETWTEPRPIVINGLPYNYQRPFDPTLALTYDKKIRVYYSSSEGMPAGGMNSSINTYSAISNDGLNYNFENNPRFDHPTNRVIDPSCILFNGLYHYSAPIGAPQEGAYHCTSFDGIIFKQENNYLSDNIHNWTGNFMVESQNELRFYGSGQYIWYNFSSDGFSWKSFINTNLRGGDPTIIKLSNGNYIIIYVGPSYSTGIIESTVSSIDDFSLYQNYPNPFNPSTVISYQLVVSSYVTLKIYQIHGKEIKALVNQHQEPGVYNVSLDFEKMSFSSGIYLCKMRAGSYSKSIKMVFLK